MSDFGITDEEFIEGLANDRQYATHVLCTHHLGWSFQQLQLLEDYAATLTHICDEERVKLKLGKAQAEWDAAGRRYEAIAKSTFGTVVALLIKAGIRAQHAQYLRAVVDLRNEFVHKLHHVVPFPGEFQNSASHARSIFEECSTMASGSRVRSTTYQRYSLTPASSFEPASARMDGV